MITLTYNKQKYIRYNNYWVDEHYEVAPLVLQDILDREFSATIDLSRYTVRELVRLADDFKGNESYHLAAKHYQEALSHASIEECRYIYPRVTSCLRRIGKAREAVRLLTFIKEKFGLSMITPVLLTSVAAAYCDLNEYDNALNCAKRAYAMLNGNASEELRLVFKRIQKLTQ